MSRIVWQGGIAPHSLHEALDSPSLASHVGDLLERFAIDLRVDVHQDEGANVRAHWDPGRREIKALLGPAGDPLDRYFVLMHEFGHCAEGHVGSPDRDHSERIEREAWRWAITTAEVGPSARALAGMVQDFKSYLRQPAPFFEPAWDVEDARAEAEAGKWIESLIAARWPSA